MYALKGDKTGRDANATPAVVGYTLNSMALAKAGIVFYYGREQAFQQKKIRACPDPSPAFVKGDENQHERALAHKTQNDEQVHVPFPRR